MRSADRRPDRGQKDPVKLAVGISQTTKIWMTLNLIGNNPMFD